MLKNIITTVFMLGKPVPMAMPYLLQLGISSTVDVPTFIIEEDFGVDIHIDRVEGI